MKDIQKLLRPVYYYDSGIYYQVDSCSKHKLVHKTDKNKLKNFIVLDVTLNKIYSKEEFLREYDLESSSNSYIIQFLDTLKFKVYRKIKGI
jgi:hypothetical protein